MKHAMDYLALSFAALPLSGLLGLILYKVCPPVRRWVDREKTWLRKGRSASTQTRTRR